MTEGDALVEVLLLEVDGRRVGLPAAAVVEVIACPTLEPVTKGPPFVEGYVDVRGEILPVLSLRERLGRERRAPHVDDHLVRVDTGARHLLMRVDRALDLVGVDPARLTPLDARHAPIGSAASTDEGVLLIQDPERFLSVEEAAQL